MNKRQVVVLWIVAIVLAAAAFFTRSGNSKGAESKTERSRGQTVLADFPADQVAKIKVSSGENTTTLVRKDGKWTIEEREGYPAKTTSVNDFLRSLAEVKVTEGVEAAPSYAPRFGMDPGASKPEDRGTEVVLSNDAGTELAHITLGKNLQAAGDDPMASMMGGGGGSTGRFVRNHADETGVYKVSEMFSALTPEPKSWLNDEFLKVEKIKSVTVSPAAQPDKVDWKVTRADENGEFTLDGAQAGETLDTTAASTLKSLFSYARFEDVVSADKASDMGKALEMRTVKIETFEGFVYNITLTPIEAEKPKEADPNAAPPEENYLMTVDVEGTLPTERKKEEKESAEDAKAKDKAFADRKTELEKRLAAEKAMNGKTFQVTKYTVDALLKPRAELIKKPEAPAANNAAPSGLPPGFPPGGGVATPPIQVPPRPARKPVEAVTPPIAIPPLEEGEEMPKENKPAEEKPAEDKPAEEKKEQ
ncbi:DUF4340 domain-containing protein [Luteolibacter arcticus]|uniref:DUF4340 domain-containing protein n=1 Tax=Luteolibacter arcticus TaxID=1581411 RepID=A0ABT3GKS2_9BACT|nr:DUF4340 domain-containing protein [Luteolibacter arcticus]MCW1924106.1 DUF4340 domain-containing protein [Luteolibacter arcticus]